MCMYVYGNMCGFRARPTFASVLGRVVARFRTHINTYTHTHTQAKDSTGANRTSGGDPFIVRVYTSVGRASEDPSVKRRESLLLLDEDQEDNNNENEESLREPEGDAYVTVVDNKDGSYDCSFIPLDPGMYVCVYVCVFVCTRMCVFACLCANVVFVLL
jgi:hypothetical protein